MGKRFVAWTIAAAVALTFTAPVMPPVYAADDEIKVEIAGKPLVFDHDPVIEQGTTLVQFRPVFEAMGLQVGWDPETRKVTGERRGVYVELTLDDPTAVVNGETKTLEQAPRLIDGHTFVPLRFVGEASEYEVSWQEDMRTIALKPTLVTSVLDLINNSALRFVRSDGAGDAAVWDGTGKLLSPTGEEIYDGGFKNGSLDGQGVLQLHNMPLYVGEWKNSRFDGTGKLYLDGKVDYEGGFVKGKKQGTGKQYNADGKLVYEGDFVAGKMEGTGKLYDTETGALLYEGQMKDDREDGVGKLFYPSGMVYYEGDFKNGKKDGNGKLFTEDGEIVYDGPFQDNKQVNSFASYVTDRIRKLHDWKKIDTKYLALYYYSDEAVVQTAAAKLDAIVESVRSKLGQHLPKMEAGATRIPVYIMPPDDFRKDLNMPYDSIVGQWYDTTMFLSLRTDKDSMYRFFQHEMTHATTIGSVDRKAKDVPVWFSEGTAVYHESDAPYNRDGNTREENMRYVVRKGKLLSWDKLTGIDDNSATQEELAISYAQAWSIWEYLAKTYGEDNLVQIYYQSADFADLLEKATGKNLAELEADWVKYATNKYAK